MCQILHPRIIILPTADPEVAMATVSVIVSVVLIGCSYGNKCLQQWFGTKNKKALADVRRAYERSRGRNGRVIQGRDHRARLI